MNTNKLENDIIEFYKILINNKKEYLQLFSKLQIQIEGWFRGELMNYFTNCNYKMTTKNREFPINEGDRKKVDLKIGDSYESESYWIELKHLLIGNQKGNKKSDGERKGNNFSLNFYFYSGTYITNDIEKLENVSKSSQETSYKYVLAFVSTNYPEDKKDKIESKEVLEAQINDILNYKRKEGPLTKKACLISSDFNNDCNFGYFLLKVIV